MRQRWLAIPAVVVMIFAACSSGNQGGSSAAPSAGAASGSPAAGASEGGGAGGFDAASISGDLTLQGWSAGAVEAPILEKLLEDFQAKYPNIKVKFEPVAGDYPAAMAGKFSAGDPPDLFYVDSSVAPTWIDDGLLEPLDQFAADRGFDTSQFYEGYLNAFKDPDGVVYGYPKDGNALGMAYNTDMLEAAGVEPPTSWAELETAVEALKDQDVEAPLCFSPGLDRALMFIYQNGGGLLTEDKSAAMIDTPESKEAVQWYLDRFKSGDAKAPGDMGDDWCGKALGEKHSAIVFEGGWLDPFMTDTYADVKYAWAEVPKGKEQANLAFTVSYSIGADSPNKDASWVLLTYLTGPEGMKTWTEGGVANPSRKDVPAAEGKEILVKGAEYARPWSFVPDFSRINDAFNNALTGEIEGGFSADAVVEATKAAIDDVLQ
ncbi:MAG: extracellular solute-binding protein [Candidatus Limnocylindrales bacterium]